MGLFKDIEKTLVEQEDPDYIKKDRERMFKQLQKIEKDKMKVVNDEKMHGKFFDSEDLFEDYCPLC